MLTCPIHDSWLEFYADPPGDYIRITYRQPPPPRPAVTAMDTITWQAINAGHTPPCPAATSQQQPGFVCCVPSSTKSALPGASTATPQPSRSMSGGADALRPLNNTTGGRTRTSRRMLRTRSSRPRQPPSLPYRQAPPPAVATPHPSSNPAPPVASTTVCRQLLTRLQRSPESDTSAGVGLGCRERGQEGSRQTAEGAAGPEDDIDSRADALLARSRALTELALDAVRTP